MNAGGTITASDAAGQAWDAVVVGAGPAGSFAAQGLARAGRRTLLVEAKRFPRDKVCGGCLQAQGQALLSRRGLAAAVQQAHPLAIQQLRITAPSRRLITPLHGLVAIRRSVLDQILVRAAIDDGAEFLPKTTARVPSASAELFRSVTLQTAQGVEYSTVAKIVVCADGLSHPSLSEHRQFASHIQPRSRIGLQTFVQEDGANYPIGTLTMAVGVAGYVGLTRMNADLLNVAAAINPVSLHRQMRPGTMVAEILDRCCLPVPLSLDRASWLGTPPLTRSSQRAAAHRLFLVGDAAGYVEPFTGEGMTWALAAADALVPLASEACVRWKDSYPNQWHRILRQTVMDRQWMCRLLSRLLRHPHLTGWTMNLCRVLPPLSQLAVRQVCGKSIRPTEWAVPLA
jgi:flavin-dependent dehydrogenase